MKLLLLTSIGHQVLDHLPVHQRLASEEVHLQIPAASGIGNEEIQGLLAHLVRHQRSAAMVLALLRKAVAAGQIAVMGDVQAQGLDYSRTLLEINDFILICIFRKEDALTGQLLHIFQHLADVALGPAVLQFRDNLIRLTGLVYQADNLVSQLVHHMDSPAVHVQDDVISIIIVTMYHVVSLNKIPVIAQIPRRQRRGILKALKICLIYAARMSGFLRCRMSYMLTGRMSGTLRSRLFSRYSAESVCSVSEYASSWFPSCLSIFQGLSGDTL